MQQDELNLRQCRPTRAGEGMIRWRLWAPKAQRVELMLFDDDANASTVTRVVEMFPAGHEGHFTAEAAGQAGQRYAYRLDGGAPRPDPASLWQPDGVHRPSAVVFPEDFPWTDQNWHGIAREDIVFYELHVGTFTPEGTFEAVIPRLAELKELGITAIELMPVAQFPGGRNWGYDGVHLFAPQNTYGGPHGLQKLVDAAHAHGLAIFLDVVYNHFGPEGNYAGEFGHYFSNRYNTPWGPAFNFDSAGSDPVRDFVLDNVQLWIGDYHFDGLRLDAVHAMFDISPVHILAEVKEVADKAAAQRNASATIVVESLLNDVRMVQPRERGGYGLDAEWNEDFHHAVIAYFTGEKHGKYVDYGPAEHIARVLQNTFILAGGYSRYRRRRWGSAATGVPGDRFVIGIQNHDHIGNRALGERFDALVTPDVHRVCACLMLLAPHLPLIYMGEEYAERNPFLFFCSFEDEGLIESVRLGRRRDYELEGGLPDPQAESSFTGSRLSWAWPEGSPQAGMRQLYRDLLAARRDWPALRNWNDRHARLISTSADGLVLELIRGATSIDAPGALACYFNLSGKTQSLADVPRGGMQLRFSSEDSIYRGSTEQTPVLADELLPFECRVYSV
jgi:maltooligosyltrehalose trehalohydrolase